MNNTDDTLRYPIGKFAPRDTYSPEERNAFIQSIEDLPRQIEDLVSGFSPEQWATPYRPDGWTARQVVHHISDSHTNAYVRIKWTLTEDTPLIKAYDEKLWALTPEVALDPSLSLSLIRALHAKWTALLKRIPEEQLQRSFIHPDTGKKNSVERMLALYSWHGEHHLGHLKIIASR